LTPSLDTEELRLTRNVKYVTLQQRTPARNPQSTGSSISLFNSHH